MSVNISILLFMKPEHELRFPGCEGDWPMRIRELADDLGQWLHLVADMTERLQNDGRVLTLGLYTIDCTLEGMSSAQAKKHLRSLGIDPKHCSIEEIEDDEIDGQAAAQEERPAKKKRARNSVRK